MRALSAVAAIIACFLASIWLIEAGKAACVALAVTDPRSLNCFEFWFNRYQTFIAAIIALVIAGATIAAVRYQTQSADRVARRTEVSAEETLRSIILDRTRIYAEVWKGIDWVLDSTINESEKTTRALTMCGLFMGLEERFEFELMRTLVESTPPTSRVKLVRLLMRWEEMLNHLDTFPDKGDGKDFRQWFSLLRIRFTFIAMALERYDVLLADVFAGVGQPFVNPGNTVKRTIGIRTSLIEAYTNRTTIEC